MALFSFLEHLNLIEDDSSRYEVGISNEGFSYLDLVSEKQARKLTFAEKQERETSAALDGSTRAHGQSNIKQIETLDHDDVCFDTDLLAILRDIEQRRQTPAIFPRALGGACLFVICWLVFLLNLQYPLIAFVLSSFVVIPAIAFGLVNAWFLDRSRRDVHFAYKISGKGETAFAQLNQALRGINDSGQTLLFVGRRHFEDTRYSGGAESLPEFKDVEFLRGKPPLLDLDFDVWHLRAFNRDLYFMPDHVLVYDGASMGGVNYGNLDVSTQTEISQARDLATRTRDAKVVGKTYRFVNKSGEPDQRFNNNSEVPLIEYGVLKLRGSGLDISLFVSNQQSAFNVPGGLADIRDLARKPVQKVAEKRRSEAAERHRERQNNVYSVVLDALGCIMFADGKASREERDTIQRLLQRIRVPWDEAEVEQRMRDFRNRASSEGLAAVVKDVCSRTSTITENRQREALRKCLDHVIAADGKIDPRETEIRDQIVEALG